jgi:hypothetical protein
VHWETQYRKVVEELSCIRRPDTGRQCRRASVCCIGSPNTNESDSELKRRLSAGLSFGPPEHVSVGDFAI